MLKVGGVTSQQARVYEEFANCVPGFLPPKQPPTKITQVDCHKGLAIQLMSNVSVLSCCQGYPADEVVHILEKCAQELQQDLNATAAPPSNSHVMAMHLLYDTLQQVLLMRGDAASALLLLQKVMAMCGHGIASLPISLSICLSVHPFICLYPFVCLSVYLFVYPSICLSVICLSIHLFVCLSIGLSVYLSVSIYLSVCLSVYPSMPSPHEQCNFCIRWSANLHVQ